MLVRRCCVRTRRLAVRQGERSRAAILRCAQELFCAKGFAASSLRDLAAVLELSPAAVYYHFESKAELLDALVVPALDELDAVLERAGGQDPRVLLDDYVDVLVRHRSACVLLYRDLSVVAEPSVGRRVGEQEEAWVRRLAGRRPSRSGRVRAAAALGAVRQVALAVPARDVRAERSRLVAASATLLTIR